MRLVTRMPIKELNLVHYKFSGYAVIIIEDVGIKSE